MRQERWSFVLFFVLLLLSSAVPLAAVTVTPGQGVSFNQIDYKFAQAALLDSSAGRITVDVPTLRAQTGLSSGFINVATGLGWVVRNVPVFPGYPYPSISTSFNLGSAAGTDVTSLPAYVTYEPNPVTSFSGGPMTAFPVGDWETGAEGVGARITSIPPPPPPATFPFQAGGPNEAGFQLGHTMVQTAHMQCLPASVASSLQWLEDTYGLTVPHPNNPGRDGDGTLVGQLDREMGRTSRSRVDGDGVPNSVTGLRGKLRYIGKNGLTDRLLIKHMGVSGNVSETVKGPDGKDVTVTSRGLGNNVTVEALIKEIRDGEDVELIFLYVGGGGHAVEVLAAGKTLGVPWLIHQSDYRQSDMDDSLDGDGIPDNEGTDAIDFSTLFDTDGDGRPNLVYEGLDANLDAFYSQSPGEVDQFSNTSAAFDLKFPSGAVERVMLAGPSVVHVDIGFNGEAVDSDGDGKDQVRTEMVRLDLSGSSPTLGAISLRLRDPSKDPFQRSGGEIEESADTMPGRLDLPPFAPGGTAASFFGVFFEVTVSSPFGPIILHNRQSKPMQGLITHKPPAPGNVYENPDPIPLYTEDNQPSGYEIVASKHVARREDVPPTCSVNIMPGTGADATIGDAGTGLSTIVVTKKENATVDVPGFALGSPGPVVVKARKIAAGPSMVELKITDVSGNTITCDPVLTLQVREQGKPVSEMFEHLPAAERYVTVVNGSPGLTNLHVTVNGRLFVLSGLRDGERRALDVSAAMRPGNDNVIVLTAHGKPGGGADVAIHD